MKQGSQIWESWDNGTYVGSRRSHGRVTVEPDWILNVTGKVYGDSGRGPFRWYQNALNDQVEIEVPNVKTINIDRSIDTDIGSCTLAIYNQWMNNNGELPDIANQLGRPGYFSWGHGSSDEAAARWNQIPNSWENVLLPNALVRTYQGYGGFEEDGTPMSIPDAVEGGFITLTGVWLIDEVDLKSSGMIDLKCRDVGKLLGVQQYFPPLVAADQYLEQFCRWRYDYFDAKFNPRTPIVTTNSGQEHPTYLDSSLDRWYGSNHAAHGHKGTDSIDGSTDTFSWSPGNYSPESTFCTDWWEYSVNGQVNSVYIHPWAGNYTMYISIFENGAWVSNGEGLIPYNMTPLIGTNYDDYGAPRWVDTGADIPYVMRTGVPWEEADWYELPRTFNAERIRITFKDHTYTDYGPWHYRAGIRDIQVQVSRTVTSSPPDPWTFTIESYRNPDVVNEQGYWVSAEDGQVFAFGDARLHTKVSGVTIENTYTFPVIAVRQTPTAQGYWLMQTNGKIFAYGDATDIGDGYVAGDTANYIDFAVTPTGLGFWLLKRDGIVVSVGDATDHGSAAQSGSMTADEKLSYTGTSIESTTGDGYWIVNGDGEVQNFGDAVDHGGIVARDSLQPNEWVRSIRRTSDDGGYWILSGSGHVYPLGNANYVDFTQAIYPTTSGATKGLVDESLYEDFRQLTWAIAPTPTDAGFWIIRANGEIFHNGDAQEWGHPGSQGTIRKDGNYKDYADIVKLLLGWAGFLYFTPDHEDNTDLVIYERSHDIKSNGIPTIYGNIESTGAFADECISLDTFDKHTIIDGINTLKEIVGYIFYIDSEGAACFQSPNWWSIGNFWNDGTPTDFIPEIDELTVLTDYGVVYSDDSSRSEIIISTEDPYPTGGDGRTAPGTLITRLIPATASLLRGIQKPAMWVNGVFKNMAEQKIMAELIAMQIWFQQRIGSVTCLANPCIEINDQVRIYERTTAETYVHYVRAVNTSHDLDTGQYMMTLTTHWLGTADDWVITRDNIPAPTEAPLANAQHIQISPELIEWLKKVDSKTLQVARLNDFGLLSPATIDGAGDEIVGGEGGAADGNFDA